MKFLIDAQLPRRLALWLNNSGFDAVHTLDLPLRNLTSDTQINEISISEERIVITKDSDFVDSFLIQKKPYKLLLISTGNIRNSELETLLQANIERLKVTFDAGYEFVELNQKTIIIHS